MIEYISFLQEMNLDTFESLPLTPITYYLFLNSHKRKNSQLYNESAQNVTNTIIFYGSNLPTNVKITYCSLWNKHES